MLLSLKVRVKPTGIRIVTAYILTYLLIQESVAKEYITA